MLEIQGKRNTALIYADKIEKEAKRQIAEILREEGYSHSKIRIMPDVHAGKTVPIGTTMTITDRVSPALVGVDIGCGIDTVFFEDKSVDFKELDGFIHANIPAGSDIRETPFDNEIASLLDELCCRDVIDHDGTLRSIGTLGGGNHFIEIDVDSKGRHALVIHSGSRRLGCDVAMHYQRLAYKYQCKKAMRSHKSVSRSKYGDDEFFTKGHKREMKAGPGVKFEYAMLEGELFSMYMHDIRLVQIFAQYNRNAIAETICRGMSFDVTEGFTCRHNFIDERSMILRKGAISAKLGESVIIPLNMRDGAILGTGLGNPDWNYSAPHGAGRICSRGDAAHAYTVEEYREQMSGVYSTTVTKETLDECPMAYKPMDRILDFISETVKVDEIIKPVYNFKATNN